MRSSAVRGNFTSGRRPLGSWSSVLKVPNKLINLISYLLHSFIIFSSVHFLAIYNVLSFLSFVRMLSLRRIITTLQQFWFLQTTQQTEGTLIQSTMQYQLGRRSEVVHTCILFVVISYGEIIAWKLKVEYFTFGLKCGFWQQATRSFPASKLYGGSNRFPASFISMFHLGFLYLIKFSKSRVSVNPSTDFFF